MRLRLPAPGVFAAITLLILAGGLLFSIWWPYHREQAVIDSLEGVLDVEYEIHGPAVLEPYSDSEWLTWFRRIHGLRIEQLGASDAHVPSLAPLVHCATISLYYCVIDQRLAARLAECRGLRSLELEACTIEADGLRGLDGHGGLSDIRMTHSEAVGNVLELPAAPALVSFRGDGNWSLRELDVSAARVLWRVEVKNCRFDDAGVEALLAAPQLTVLRMPATHVTDASVDTLLELRRLRFVDLRHDHRMSPAGIARLAELPRLQTVAVWQAVPPDDFDSLHETLPQATMDYRP